MRRGGGHVVEQRSGESQVGKQRLERVQRSTGVQLWLVGRWEQWGYRTWFWRELWRPGRGGAPRRWQRNERERRSDVSRRWSLHGNDRRRRVHRWQRRGVCERGPRGRSHGRQRSGRSERPVGVQLGLFEGRQQWGAASRVGRRHVGARRRGSSRRGKRDERVRGWSEPGAGSELGLDGRLRPRGVRGGDDGKWRRGALVVVERGRERGERSAGV